MIRDSRRVPGASLWNDGPAVALDLITDRPADVARAWHAAFVALWPRFSRALAATWPAMPPEAGQTPFVRVYDGGATVGFAAPFTILYEAALLNDLAAEAALAGRPPDLAAAGALGDAAAHAYDPALEALRAEARRRGVNVLVGEGLVTLGSGDAARTYPLDAPPDLIGVPWEAITDVPVGLVTGTNGKTTTVRLVARMLREAGCRAGFTSTESVVVGGEVVLTGDFAGPEGARRLLRDTRTGAAVLETSRGGLLRRGLALQFADVALVTNAGADHLGDYGILDVSDVARAKLAIRKGLRPGAPLVLNADDATLGPAADALGLGARWFSQNGAHPRLGATAAFVREGAFVLRTPDAEAELGRVDTTPFTFGGTARYNVSNALGAMLVAHALGADAPAMRRALAAFGRTPEDNPGRLGLHVLGDLHVVVDYAHNDDGVSAVVPALRTIPARRRLVLISQAGDRSDADNARMAAALMGLDPALVMITELPGYERGRAHGGTAESLARGLEAAGLPRVQMRFADRPGAGAAALLGQARPGDLVVLFLHADRAEVEALLRDPDARYVHKKAGGPL